jgi:hypothetical protein
MRCLVLWIASAAGALAQLVTGSMVGSVTDSSGSRVPSVKVVLTSEGTGVARTAATDAGGNFVFNAVQPGAYVVSAEHAGFKKLEKRGLTVNPNETVTVGELRLEVGQVSESVTVSAAGEVVQTATSERSGIITNEQVENLTTINRDFAALVSLLPGVVENPGAETQGFGSNSTFNVQGARITSNSVAIDGMPVTQPNGSDTGTYMSMDSVAAVRLTTSTYQAEFGRKPGSAIQAVTKSGAKEYHGTLYWYKRHEMFNANSFFNNRQGIPEARYRYTTAGGNIGGPLLIPGLTGRHRRRAFFFFAAEQLREARPQAIRNLTTPTEAERAGDFSSSRDTNNALITVRDPLTKVAFPNNVIPASRINTSGQNYLKLLPLPNALNLAVTRGTYNYQAQESLFIPKSSEVLRVDIPIDDKTNVYGRFNYWWEKQQGWAVPGGNSNWGWMPSSYLDSSRSLVLNVSRILTASTVLEASGSVLHWTELAAPLREEALTRITRKASGVNIPQVHAENNPLNFVPNATFGGVSSAISTNLEGRFPLGGTNYIQTYSANLTRTAGPHILKAGFWIERWDISKVGSGAFNGTIDFTRNTTNPNDSNHPFGNALLGNYYSYAESTTRPPFYIALTSTEWFVQDNWKASRRLTLDLGLRFGWSQPGHSPEQFEAGFSPAAFSAARQVALIRPVLNAGARVGADPAGNLYAAQYIGGIAPKVGDPYNGSIDRRTNPDYPAGLQDASGIKLAPRFGFAWDPFGKGKTAVRGGWGLFYEILEHTFNNVTNPPLQTTPVSYNSSFADITAQAGTLFPFGSVGFDTRRPLGRVMNYSFGIQQSVGFGTVVDASYVAALSRHLLTRRNINSIPLGTNFLASSRDTTNNSTLPASFLRPYLGYNDINYYIYDGNAAYHSLQVTANRRFSRGFQFGLAWTWSKALDYADTDGANISTLVNPRIWNYGKAGFDRTHIVKLNWTWDLPRFSRVWKNSFTRQVLDGWQLSGITSFISGSPMGIGLGFTYSVDTTGSPTDGARVVMLQNPTLARGDRDFFHAFNLNAFGPPAVGTVGNAPKDVFRGPGINNWDVSMFKNFRLPGERFKLQFRAEGYNAWNHTQYSGVDTAARFDQQGRQTSQTFGSYTAARNARRVQLALRLQF